jgi:hypothetical protein
LGADEGVTEGQDKEDERVVGGGEDTAVSLEQEETCSTTKRTARGMGKNAHIHGLDMEVSGGAGGPGLVVPVVVNLVDDVSVGETCPRQPGAAGNK